MSIYQSARVKAKNAETPSLTSIPSLMWTTLGQEHLLKQLDAALRAGRLAHAYLLTGPPHVGKMTLALELAAAVNCAGRDAPAVDAGPCGHCSACTRIRRGVYADLHVVAVGGDPRVPTRISIQQIRDTENFLALTSVEGPWKVVIIDGAESLSAGQSESANALLKTLEEPPEHVLILLLTTNPDAVLPTIRSRCQLLELRPMAGSVLAEHLVNQRDVTPDTARWLAGLARGCPGWAFRALSDPAVLDERAEELDLITETALAPLDQRFDYANILANQFSRDRESVRQRLYLWQRWWRDLLLVKEGVGQHVQNTDRQDELATQADALSTTDIVAFVRRIQETLAALDANANPRLALEVLMLAVPAR